MKTTITQNQIFRTFSRLQRSCYSAVFLLTFLLSASSSWGQTFRSSSTNKGNAASLIITKPAGLQVGDLMIAQISRSSNLGVTMTNTTSSGWSIVSGIQYRTNNNERFHTTILSKIANQTDVQIATTGFTFSGNDTEGMIGAIMAFYDACSLSVVGDFSATGNDQTFNAPSISTVTQNSMVLMLGGYNSKNLSISNWSIGGSSTGVNEAYDVNFDCDKDIAIGAAYKAFSSITTTGEATADISGTTNQRNVSILLAISANPTVSASTSASTICASGTVNLSSSATSNSSTAAVLINENFNGTATGWTTTNSSAGGTVANAAWTLRANGYSVCPSGCTGGSQTLNSNDASQFYLSDSDRQGNNSTTATTLKSPAFSTVGLSAASLTFYQYYRDFDTSDSAIVEVSTNNTSWTTLATYTTTDGANNAFALKTISLNSYLGQATVYIRYRYTATWSYYWAIDNVSVTGTYTTPPAATFAWTASPSGFTSSTQNPTGVSPSATTTYTVTATNSYGCTATASTTVTVRPVFTSGTISSTGQTICSGGTPTVIGSTTDSSGGDNSITYSWRSSADSYAAAISGATSSTFTPPTGLTATTSYRRYAKDGTCSTTPTVSTGTWTVTVNPNVTPTFTQVSAICSGAALSALPTTSNNSITGTWSPALNNTATTTYTFTPTAGQCASTASMTITVNALPTATISAGSATTFCSGENAVLTASSGSTYVWKKDGVAISSATLQTYTATTSGSYTVTVTNANSCSATSAATIVTVNALPSQATATSVNNCGTAVLTATAAGSSTVIWYSDALGNTAVSTAGATSTLTLVNPSAANTYYAYTYANGCRSENYYAAQVIINYSTTFTGGTSGTNTDWFTAANWSCASVPTNATNVIIPTGKSVSMSYLPNQGPAYANSLTLQGTANFTVTSDHSTNISDKVTVPTTAAFTLQNNASLVQTENVANEGVITVVKTTPTERPLYLNDAVMWSSPVAQKLKAISTNTPDAYFMQHAPLTNSWASISSPSTTDFTQGKGYLVRTPSTFSGSSAQPWTVSFTGVPNNGAITYNAGNMDSVERFLLVGNPYPSAISIAAFKAANPNITGVFYFFRKPNSASDISGYGTYNAQGIFTSNDGTRGALQPGSVIPSGQGFFVRMKANSGAYTNDGKIYFTNAMRVANDHGHFNRTNTNIDMYRLLVQTPTTGNNQMIVNYDPETTVDYDLGVDAVAFTDGTTDLSSIMNTKNYRIQARGDYNAADVIPLRFKTGVAGEHRIKLQDVQGVFAADQMVCIKDNVTGTLHNLTANGDYVFTATAGTFTNRFEVVYQQAYYTALQSVSCGSTLANMSSLVYADVIEGASGYRFKVVNNTTSAVQTIDRQYHWFTLNMLPSYDYNTSYSISVQVQKDGVWVGYYGTPCSVNSPNIASTGIMQINPSQCGVTLPTLGYVIATTPVAGATGYKFRITNTTAGASGANLVQEITRTNHWFTLAMLARYNYGSSYAIEVAVKTTGGYTPYGNACTVYSPAVPTLVSCGQAVATATTLVRTTAMTMATQYRFQVTRMATQETITFDTANYWFSFRVNVPGYAAGEQYGVRIAVMTAGAWSPYGDACDLTAPSASARTTEEAAPSEANLFKPVAYPNPFTSTFGISLATPSADVVNIIVYDLQGRLIEKQNVFVSQLDSLQIGTNYPSGDYLLVVAQGANIKTSHIHKE